MSDRLIRNRFEYGSALHAIREESSQSFHAAPLVKVLENANAPDLANSFLQFPSRPSSGPEPSPARQSPMTAAIYDAPRSAPIGFVARVVFRQPGCGKRHRTFTITVSGGFIIFWQRTIRFGRGSN
jgi:hypothetical protein